MCVDDLIEVEMSNGVHLWWRVVGIYLGATNQESVLELVPENQKPNTRCKPTLVPAQMLDASIDPKGVIRHHALHERTPAEKALLDMLLESNEALRSCMFVIKRRGDNTHWEALQKRIQVQLELEHSTLTPIRLQKIREAQESMGCGESPIRETCDEAGPKRDR